MSKQSVSAAHRPARGKIFFADYPQFACA